MADPRRRFFCLGLAFLPLFFAAGCFRSEPQTVREAPHERAPRPEQHPPWSSGETPDTRPFASRQGVTITLHPSDASFDVPQEWAERHEEFANNFHLDHTALDNMAWGGGDWDTEYASVCNAVLPYDRCAAHVGAGGWGLQSTSFAGLHVKVYEVNETSEMLRETIATAGVVDARRWNGGFADLKEEDGPVWGRTMISFPLDFGDYGGTAHVDFRYRPFAQRTLVFVFMYEDEERQEKVAEGILKSLRLP